MKLSYETTLGFSDTKTPMQKARTEEALNKLYRFDGVYMTEKELVVKYILEGFTVEKRENYTYVKRNGEMSKPKTQYKLYTSETAFYEITKTAYDFACYLIENGFTTDEAITNCINAEKAETERLEREKIEAEERKQKELQERLQAEKEQAKKARQEKAGNWNKLALELLSDEQLTGVKSLIFEIAKEIYPNETDENICLSIENSPFITNVGNETGSRHRVNYLFFESDSEYINRNVNMRIEKAVYAYVFGLNDSDTKLTIKDKLNKFYNGTEKKRYYQGAEVEKEKLRSRIIEIVENMVAESNDKYDFRQSINKNRETLMPLIERCKGLNVLVRPDHVAVKYQDTEHHIYFKFIS